MEKLTSAIAIKGNECYFDGVKIDGLINYEVERRINQYIFHGEFCNKTGFLAHFSTHPMSIIELQETWVSGDRVKCKMSCYISGQIKIIGE